MVLFLRRHREQPGFALWTAASALVSATLLAAGLRGLVPDALSVVTVNVATLVSMPLSLAGARRFFGLPTLPRFWLVWPVVFTSSCLWFLFVRDDLVVRTVLVMAGGAGPLAAMALLILRHRDARRLTLARALALQLGAMTSLMLFRAVWVTRQTGFTLMTESPGQYLFFGATIVLHMGIIISYVLLTADRVATQLASTGIELAARVAQLERTIGEVKTLRGLLPICAACKRIRDEHGAWTQMEVYVRDRSQAEFSHGLCPECMPRYLPAPPRMSHS